MTNKTYTVEDVVRILNKLPGIRVADKTIRTAKGLNIGSKVWGKIEFLKKQGFKHLITDSIKPSKVDKGSKEDFEEVRRKKKKRGIDTITNVKSIMKPSNFKIKK